MLLANIYLNEYDQEMSGRGVPVIRYADDIVVLAKSPRAAQRLLESTQRYLEGKLKLKMNTEKSKVVSVFSVRNFKFLGFALGKGRKWNIHSRSSEVMEEDEAKAQRLIFPKKSTKHHPIPQKDRNIYERVAELLFGGKHEERHR